MVEVLEPGVEGIIGILQGWTASIVTVHSSKFVIRDLTHINTDATGIYIGSDS